MLWLALRFHDLPLEALGIKQDGERVCVVEYKHRVYACTEAAKSSGIQIGMKTSAAYAFGEITVLSRAQHSEEELLKNIANWAYAFTPYIKRNDSDCLLLEISKCLRLFGGVKSFCTQLSESLDNKGLVYRMGLAHSEQGARLLSYRDYPVCDQDSQAIFMSRIDALPLGMLKEFADIHEQLNNMGVHLIGELLQLPRSELGKRFGQAFSHWLDELEGKIKPALCQQVEEFVFQCSTTFSYAVDNTQLLITPVANLLKQLSNFLTLHQLEASQVDWLLYSPQGQVHSFNLQISRIHTQEKLLLELTQVRLEQIRLMFSIERIELRCDRLSPLKIETRSLFYDGISSKQKAQREAEKFVARIQTHLGKQAIYQLAPKPEHIPEQQSAKVLPFEKRGLKTEGQGDLFLPQAPRPTWLFKRPQRIERKHKNLHLSTPGTKPSYLHLIQGPERIEGTWWEDKVANTNSVRDYFIAETESHVRYWIYHNLQSDNWYVHGVFA